MLNSNCIFEYRKCFPDDRCFFSEPGSGIIIENSENKSFISPSDETDDIFLERLHRSKIANRNLFYEEWTEFKYDSSSIY